jgi:hypothetical protein
MKNKIFIIAALIAAFSTIVFGQSVTITPRKVTYKRSKPLSEYKKTFVINYPKIRGLSPTLTKKVENILSYERVFDFTVKEEIGEIQWLSEADYEVDYNKNGILGVTLRIDGSGAYPDGSVKSIIINLKTGDKVRPADVFIRLNELVAKGKKAQQAEVKQAIIDIKKEDPETDEPARLFEKTNFTLKDLNEFSINDKGVTFWHDYSFPHVIRALEPEGRYFFSWAELKSFIKPGSVFAQFVR